LKLGDLLRRFRKRPLREIAVRWPSSGPQRTQPQQPPAVAGGRRPTSLPRPTPGKNQAPTAAKLATIWQPSQNAPVSARAATMPIGPERARSTAGRVLYVRAGGFPRRLVAAAIDCAVVLCVSAAVTAGAALALGVPLPRAKEVGPDLLVAGLLDRNPIAIGALGLFLGLGALYEIYFGGITGQTPGKRLMRLRVIGARGTPPGPMGGIVRFLALALSLLPAGLGWLWCLFDRERRALHDHLAGTYVIVEDR
jgi:uncharacterized RDD family membrane protein YckC